MIGASSQSFTVSDDTLFTGMSLTAGAGSPQVVVTTSPTVTNAIFTGTAGIYDDVLGRITSVTANATAQVLGFSVLVPADSTLFVVTTATCTICLYYMVNLPS